MAELEAGDTLRFSRARHSCAHATAGRGVAALAHVCEQHVSAATNGTSQAAGLVFAILVRIIVWPFLALMVVGPVVGSGFLAWAAIANNHPQRLASLLAGHHAALAVRQHQRPERLPRLFPNFDPSSLIRFPLRFGRYLVLRTLHWPADAQHHCGLPGLAGRRSWNRRGGQRAGAARSGGAGGLRGDEHLSDAHDRRMA